jgi:membrane-bound lytic murein transglycosylase A
MIAQDTGSAIIGPARADLYWGAGEHAARIAGRIHHPGTRPQRGLTEFSF